MKVTEIANHQLFKIIICTTYIAEIIRFFIDNHKTFVIYSLVLAFHWKLFHSSIFSFILDSFESLFTEWTTIFSFSCPFLNAFEAKYMYTAFQRSLNFIRHFTLADCANLFLFVRIPLSYRHKIIFNFILESFKPPLF